MNRVFYVGGSCILEIQVQPEQDQSILEVHAELRIEIANKSEILPLECKKKGNAFHCHSTWGLSKEDDCPTSGQAFVTGHLMCIFKDSIAYYEFEVRHAIIEDKQDAKTIVNSYTLDGGSLLKIGGINTALGSNASGDNLLKKINDSAPILKEVKVLESDWRPEDAIIDLENEYSRPDKCEELTLGNDDFSIHIISKDDISIGRLPQNDIILIDWYNNNAYNQYPTNTVSSKHALLHYDGKEICLECKDEGNVVQIRRQNEVIIIKKGEKFYINSSNSTEHSLSFSFGLIALSTEIQTCPQKKMRDKMCPNCLANPIRALVLKREDKLPEYFVCVWECCDLGTIHSRLKGFRIYRRNGGFMLLTPHGKLFNLVAGMTLNVDGLQLKVEEKLKIGFKSELK